MLWQLGKKDDYSDDNIILQVTYADMFTLYWIAFSSWCEKLSFIVWTPIWYQCLFTIFALVSALGWLVEIWQLSRWGATGELKVEFKFQRRSWKPSFLLSPHRQSAPESLLALQAMWTQPSLTEWACILGLILLSREGGQKWQLDNQPPRQYLYMKSIFL